MHGRGARCADIVATTARTLARHVGHDAAVVRAVLRAGIEANRACYDERRRHALAHEFCPVCAEACRRCGKACGDLSTG
jgi:hypothetical protein